jgi:hypothetical protein
MSNEYKVTVFQQIGQAGDLFALVLRVSAAAPIEWVKQHADEIAARGIQQDRVASRLGQPVALAVEVAS